MSYTLRPEVLALLNAIAPFLIAFSSACAGVAVLVLALGRLMRGAAFWKAAHYFSKSFEDARDRPDAKLLTLFSAFGLVILIVVYGLVSQYWPPVYIVPTLVGFVAAGYGFSAQENRAKINAESAMAQAALTGQPTPAPAPASATTTTTTTIGTE